MKINIEKIEDHSSPLNMFGPKKSTIMSSKMPENHFSPWVQYPDHYKFFSVHFSLNQDVRHVIRRTYDLTEFAKDLVGVSIFGFRAFSLFTFIFARLRLNSLLTNRLFFITQKEKVDLGRFFKRN